MNKNKFKILFILILSIFGINNVYALPDDSSLTDETNNPIAEEENLSTELYTNPNTGYQLIIEDDANLLSDFEEEKLRKEMQPLTEYGNIAFKSTEVSSYSTSAFSDSYYHDKFGTASGTVFVVDMRRRQIYIFSDGANYETITNGKADIITDNIYTYASEGDYYKCASVAYEQMYTILNGGKIAEPMRYISNTLIALTAKIFDKLYNCLNKYRY